MVIYSLVDVTRKDTLIDVDLYRSTKSVVNDIKRWGGANKYCIGFVDQISLTAQNADTHFKTHNHMHVFCCNEHVFTIKKHVIRG